MIPYPSKVEFKTGKFTLNSETKIDISPELTDITDYLIDLINSSTGFSLSTNLEASRKNTISLVLHETSEILTSEGYQLSINLDNIIIEAKTHQGIFYGIQTLRQLLPIEIESREEIKEFIWTVPCISIVDNPRFIWRGLMFDVGRHFHDVATIKRTLDLLALMKMNVFHWHLTEDQGWRIEIKKYPKLVEIGSKREDTRIGGWTSKKFRGKPHKGHYTQEQIKEIVEYASERFIKVIPEIEIPGHSSAAIASYPDLSCEGKRINVPTKFGIFDEILCPGKETTFEFLENVLEEVISLFPSNIIHVGGDEAPKKKWRQCKDCQRRMREEGLKTVQDLQHYTTKRIGMFLANKSKKLMGWNEILTKTSDRKFIVQWWMRGKRNIKNHINEGGEVVISKFFRVYLDYNYIVTPLKKTYFHEPNLKNTKPEQNRQILGIEAPIWTEWVPDRDRLDWQLFPRLAAVSEIGWTIKSNKNYINFRKRLIDFSRRLYYLGVKYADLKKVDPNLLKRIWNLRRAFKWPEI
ncbi:MAG: beta-N-acetylhexosaminidase [Candidatus Heimdallarchaeaceae archaeon]